MHPVAPSVHRVRSLVVGLGIAAVASSTLASVAAPTVAAADPLACSGYPQARVFLESGGWWQPSGSGTTRRVALGTCWPVGATVTGRLHLDLRVRLAGQPAGSRVAAVSLGTATATDLQSIPTSIAGDSAGVTTAWVGADIDTTKLHDGLNEVRLSAHVQHADGTKMYQSTGWLVRLANGNARSDDRPGGWGTERRAWHAGAAYAAARLTSDVPRSVSGTWTPSVRLDRGAAGVAVTGHLASVDPDLLTGAGGKVVHKGAGPYSGTVAIDTTALADGLHHLVLVTSQDYTGTEPAGRNSGVEVVPFVVDNGLRTTAKPTATPAPTAKPTTAPTATPKPTTAPTATPKPTTAPAATPTPTVKPTVKPTMTPAPTQAPLPTATPTPPPASGGVSRPFTATSAWNTPIAGGATVDPRSGSMIATITGSLSSNPSSFTYPVYYADATTPKYNVTPTDIQWTVVAADESTTRTATLSVPIPAEAKASSGTDMQMIVIDRVSGAEYDLWGAARTSTGGWTARNGSRYNTAWDGTPAKYGSRGAGVPYLAGLVRPEEIKAGVINHALAFAYNQPRASKFVYPASKTDGKSTLAYAMPEGARIRLDPTATEADFTAWGLDRTGKILA